MSTVTWWSWGSDVAHARRGRSRGVALCGAAMHRFACYSNGSVPLCKECVALAGPTLSNHAKRWMRARFAKVIEEDKSTDGFWEDLGRALGVEDWRELDDATMEAAKEYCDQVAERIRR